MGFDYTVTQNNLIVISLNATGLADCAVSCWGHAFVEVVIEARVIKSIL